MSTPVTPEWVPTVEDVAAHLRARTRDSTGAEVGTFTDGTVPTDVQVKDMIDSALPYVLNGLQLAAIPAVLIERARAMAAIKAAELVEVSYFPEQDTGTVARLRDLFKDLLPAVQVDAQGNPVTPPVDTTPPDFTFSDCDPGWDGTFGIPVEIVVRRLIP